MIVRNAALLEKIADQIEAEPDRWYQPDVVAELLCGTAYCLGGWALYLSGIDPQESGALGRATALLGLNYHESHFMFYNGMDHMDQPLAYKEVAEWLRAIARGDDVRETAPEWWAPEWWGSE